MNLDATAQYLASFFRSHLSDYRHMMLDAGSSRFSAFDEEPWVIQAIRNVVLNIEDNYRDLSVPEAYASPKLLLEALQGLRDLADRQLGEVEAVNQRNGSKWYRSILHWT